jgi:hypothetical protein
LVANVHGSVGYERQDEDADDDVGHGRSRSFWDATVSPGEIPPTKLGGSDEMDW